MKRVAGAAILFAGLLAFFAASAQAQGKGTKICDNCDGAQKQKDRAKCDVCKNCLYDDGLKKCFDVTFSPTSSPSAAPTAKGTNEPTVSPSAAPTTASPTRGNIQCNNCDGALKQKNRKECDKCVNCQYDDDQKKCFDFTESPTESPTQPTEAPTPPAPQFQVNVPWDADKFDEDQQLKFSKKKVLRNDVVTFERVANASEPSTFYNVRQLLRLPEEDEPCGDPDPCFDDEVCEGWADSSLMNATNESFSFTFVFEEEGNISFGVSVGNGSASFCTQNFMRMTFFVLPEAECEVDANCTAGFNETDGLFNETLNGTRSNTPFCLEGICVECIFGDKTGRGNDHCSTNECLIDNTCEDDSRARLALFLITGVWGITVMFFIGCHYKAHERRMIIQRKELARAAKKRKQNRSTSLPRISKKHALQAFSVRELIDSSKVYFEDVRNDSAVHSVVNDLVHDERMIVTEEFRRVTLLMGIFVLDREVGTSEEVSDWVNEMKKVSEQIILGLYDIEAKKDVNVIKANLRSALQAINVVKKGLMDDPDVVRVKNKEISKLAKQEQNLRALGMKEEKIQVKRVSNKMTMYVSAKGPDGKITRELKTIETFDYVAVHDSHRTAAVQRKRWTHYTKRFIPNIFRTHPLFYAILGAWYMTVFFSFAIKIGQKFESNAEFEGNSTRFGAEYLGQNPGFRLGGYGRTMLPLPPQYDVINDPAQQIYVPMIFAFMHCALFSLGILPIPMWRGVWRDITVKYPGLRRYIPVDDFYRLHTYIAYIMLCCLFIGATIWIVGLGYFGCLKGIGRSCDGVDPPVSVEGVDQGRIIPDKWYFNPQDNVLFLRQMVWFTWFPIMPLMYWADRSPWKLGMHMFIPNVIKRNWYEFCLYSHIFVALLTVSLALFARFQVFYPVTPAWIVYFLDWFRELMLYSHKTEVLLRKRTRSDTDKHSKKAFMSVIHTSSKDDKPHAMHLYVRKPEGGFLAGAGQWMYLKVPEIDSVWHPFSLASCGKDDFLELYIGVISHDNWKKNESRYGKTVWVQDKNETWTYRLMDLMRTSTEQQIPCKVRGPYGGGFNMCFDPRYKACVVIGAGTGLPSAESVLREMIFRRRAHLPAPKFVWLVWACPTVDHLLWFWDSLVRRLACAIKDGVIRLDEEDWSTSSSLMDWFGIRIYVSRSDSRLMKTFLKDHGVLLNKKSSFIQKQASNTLREHLQEAKVRSLEHSNGNQNNIHSFQSTSSTGSVAEAEHVKVEMEAPLHPDYKEKIDPKTGACYYLHKTSGKAQWNRPSAGKQESAVVKKRGLSIFSKKNELNLGKRRSTPAETELIQNGSPSDETANWEKHVDDSTGATYYYNKETEESSWTMPECMRPKSTKPKTPRPPSGPPPRSAMRRGSVYKNQFSSKLQRQESTPMKVLEDRVANWIANDQNLIEASIDCKDFHIGRFLGGIRQFVDQEIEGKAPMAVSYCGPPGVAHVIGRAAKKSGIELEFTSDHQGG